MIFARDTALVHVAGQYDQQVPGSDIEWEATELKRSMVTEGSPGEAVYRFTAGDWEAIVASRLRSRAFETRQKMPL